MKKLLSISVSVIFIASLVFFGCKKDDDFATPVEPSAATGELVTLNVNVGLSQGDVHMGGLKSASELGDMILDPDLSGGFIIVLLDATNDALVAKDTIYPSVIGDTAIVSFTVPSNNSYKLFGMDVWAYEVFESQGVSDADKFDKSFDIATSSTFTDYNKFVENSNYYGTEIRHSMSGANWFFRAAQNVLIDTENGFDIDLCLIPKSLCAVVLNFSESMILGDVYLHTNTFDQLDSLSFASFQPGGLLSFGGVIPQGQLYVVYYQSEDAFDFSEHKLQMTVNGDYREIALSGYATTMSPDQYVYFDVNSDGVIDRNVGVTLGNVSTVTNGGDFEIILE